MFAIKSVNLKDNQQTIMEKITHENKALNNCHKTQGGYGGHMEIEHVIEHAKESRILSK